MTQNPEPGGFFCIEIELFLPLDFFRDFGSLLGAGSAFCGFGVFLLWVWGLLWVRVLPFVGSGFVFCRFMMDLEAPKGSRPGFNPKPRTRWTF